MSSHHASLRPSTSCKVEAAECKRVVLRRVRGSLATVVGGAGVVIRVYSAVNSLLVRERVVVVEGWGGVWIGVVEVMIALSWGVVVALVDRRMGVGVGVLGREERGGRVRWMVHIEGGCMVVVVVDAMVSISWEPLCERWRVEKMSIEDGVNQRR